MIIQGIFFHFSMKHVSTEKHFPEAPVMSTYNMLSAPDSVLTDINYRSICIKYG